MQRILPSRRAVWIGVLAPALWLSAATCDSTTRPATAPAASLKVSVQPAGATAGEPIGPVITVQVTDASGRVVTASEAAVRLRLAAGTGSPHAHLLGVTEVAAVHGIATFPTVSVDSAATGYRLTVTSSGLDSALTATFAVAVGPAARLAFAAAPLDVTANTPFDSTVRVVILVLDQAGNLVPTSTAAIALAIGVNPAQGRLLGTTNRNATGGVASFAGVRIDKPGPGYTLTAAAPGLATAVTEPFPVTTPVVSVTVGYGFACVLTSAGAASCWGGNTSGQLGDGTTTNRPTPTPVTGGLSFSSLSAGWYHVCGMQWTGGAACWGLNADGQLGIGSKASSTAPVPVGGAASFISVEAGRNWTCGVTAGFAAYCWGSNLDAQLGIGSNDSKTFPTLVDGGFAFASISAGTYHTCAVSTYGDGYCWGNGSWNGALGGGSYSFWPYPVTTTQSFRSISAGGTHTCAITTTPASLCWGDNTYGEVGDGTTTARWVPVAPAASPVFTSVSAGVDRTCALTALGAAYCWGYGPVGDGSTSSRSTPVAVTGGHTFVAISVGDFACGVTTSRAAYCWGGYVGGGYQVKPERVPLF